MKKEALFAIFIGIVLGLGITFGIYKFRQNTAASSNTGTDSTTSPSPTPPPSEKLLITSPQDEAVLTSTELRVSGNAEPNEMVVILLNEKEFVTQADSIGAFAQDVELAQGGNILEITTTGSDGKQTSVTLHVVVSTASLEEKVTVPAEDATPSATPKTTGKATATPKATAKPTAKPTATPKEAQ